MPGESRRARRKRIGDAAKARYHAARDAEITAPLTARTLDRELRGAERSRFSDVDRQIRGEYGQSAHMQRQIPQWFQQYRADIQAAEERTRAGFAQAAQQFQQFTQQNEAGAAQQQQALQAQEAASAAQRGATVDPNLAQISQQASASRQSSAASQSGLIGTLGANAGAHLANRGVVAGGQQIVAQQDEVRRRGAIDERARGVAREKGDFRVAYRADAREKERRYGLERAAFGLKEQSEAQDAADDAADNQRQARSDRSRARDRSARQQQARDRQNLSRAQFIAKYGITPEEAAQGVKPTRGGGRGRSGGSEGSGGGGNKPPSTPAARRNAKRDFRSALADAQGQNPKPGDGDVLTRYIRGETKVKDPLLARAVAQTAIYGGVDEKTRRRVYREYGIYLRLSKKRPKRRVPEVPGL